MPQEIEKRLLWLCKGVLKALSFLLVKNGVSYHRFEEVAKESFVEAIRDNFGVRNRKTNISRVCAISGLSRKEVNRIIEAAGQNDDYGEYRGRRAKPVLVLDKWWGDDKYLDEHGQPKALAFDGKGYTFTRLVKEVGVGDLTPTTMLAELIRVGCVLVEDGLLKAVSYTYIPATDDPQLITIAGDALRQMTWTVVQNLVTKEKDARFLQRRIITDDLPKADRLVFKRVAEHEAQMLLERLNTFATEREYQTRASRGRPLKKKEKDVPTVGMGVYYFDSTYEHQKKQ